MRRSGTATRLLLTLTALGGLWLSGCQHGRMFKARHLPAEFAAPPVSSMQRVDLSGLARSLGDSNVLFPGDLVKITVATGLESDRPPEWRGRIAEDGTVTVPLVGPVRVAGWEIPYAERVIRDASIQRGVYVDPNVSLVVEEPRSNRVTVVGAVEKPGTYKLPASNSDVLSAIVAAEGLSREAGTIVEVRHPPGWTADRSRQPFGLTSTGSQQPIPLPPRTRQIDLEQVSVNNGEDYRLEDGSTVMVMPKPKRYIHVIGLVRHANQFEMPDNTELRVLDAIAMAGNRTLEMADKVHVIRQVPGESEPVVIAVSVREAKRNGAANLTLAPGDVVSVEETPLTFVVGTVREFIRFGFSSSLPLF